MQSPIATAADYADAMLMARRARNIALWGLVALLLAQIALFCTVHFSHLLDGTANIANLDQPVQTAEIRTTTVPTELTSAPTTANRAKAARLLQYLVGLTGFLGIVLAILLSLVLLLLMNIMLVGRLIGLSHVTSALLLSLFLMLLLFPWQAFLNNQTMTASEFKIPGALYTWNELVVNGRSFHNLALTDQILRWARFLGWPLVSLVLVLMIKGRSSRGLRMALGEEVKAVDQSRPQEPQSTEEM